MTENCEFCRNKFNHAVIKEYENWELQLFLDQYYLGRTLIKLKRHTVDLTELKKKERKELFQKVLPDAKKATDNIFEPDLYNQATLGNDCRHFHLHIIPRYQTERKFMEKTFKDENWNHHYNTQKKKEVSEKMINSLIQRFREEIEE